MHACSLSTSRAACLPASAHVRSALRALFLRPALFTLAACSYRGRASLARRLFASYALSLLISERRVCVCARLAFISLQSTVTPRCIMHVDVGVKIASLRFVCVYVSRAIYRRYVPTRDKEVSLADHVPVERRGSTRQFPDRGFGSNSIDLLFEPVDGLPPPRRVASLLWRYSIAITCNPGSGGCNCDERVALPLCSLCCRALFALRDGVREPLVPRIVASRAVSGSNYTFLRGRRRRARSSKPCR